MLETLAAEPYAAEPLGEPVFGFEPFVPAWLLALLAVAVVAGAVRSYARSTRPLTWLRRLMLWFLRACAAFAVLACLACPVLVHATVYREKGLCFLVLDRSSSMTLTDAPKNRSRWAHAGSLFAQQQEALAELGRRFEVRRLLFDARPAETDRLPGEGDASTANVRPDGRATDLTALFEQLEREASGSDCAGALLISDGRHNAGSDPVAAVQRLRSIGLPLFAVGVGQEETPADFRDVQVKMLEVPERAYVGGHVSIVVELESTLPQPAVVPLTVTVNDQEIFVRKLQLPAGTEVQRIEVPYSPKELGMQRVVARAGAVAKEANINNNVRSAFLRVFRSRLGIWYVEGAIRKEFGAIRSALESAPNVKLYAINAIGLGDQVRSDLLPETDAGWQDLRLVILGDFPAKRFPRKQLERLAQFVADGGSVLMIGGIENFGPGGWHLTPLSDVLPVEMGWDDKAVQGPLRIYPAPESVGHPALRLADDPGESATAWRRLPELPGVNGVKGVKPAARKLLNAGLFPLLVVQDYGKGRSGVFTGDATWKWALKAGEGETLKRFWRSLAVWLTRSDYRSADKVVFVETDRLQYLLGDEVNFNAVVQETDAAKGRLADARVMASLVLQNGARRTWELGRGPGTFASRNVPPNPGTYTFTVQAITPGGEELGKDSVSFQVDVPDVENENPKANLRLLQRLAGASGGTYFDAEHGGQAFEQLLQRQAGFEKTVRSSSPLWNHWSLFLVFVALLTAEWALRKRWGLV